LWGGSIAICTVLAASTAAVAARAPLDAPNAAGVQHALRSAHVSFALPVTYAQHRSINTNRPMRGFYERPLTLASGRVCNLQLAANSQLQASKPLVADAAKVWGGNAFAITQRGRTGALRWYAGRSGTMRIAFAWQPAPSGLASSRLHYLSVRMMLGTVEPNDQTACTAAITHERQTLTTAVRSARAVQASLRSRRADRA
jgi:hypothetical protein